MGEAKGNDVYKQELLDYDGDDDKAVDAAAKPAAGHAAARKGNVGSHSSGFTDFLLKPELLRAIQNFGVETRTNARSTPPKFLFHGRATPARPLDYEEDDNKAVDAAKPASRHAAPKKGGVGIHTSGFRNFILKPELLRAIQNFGLEHP